MSENRGRASLGEFPIKSLKMDQIAVSPTQAYRWWPEACLRRQRGHNNIVNESRIYAVQQVFLPPRPDQTAKWHQASPLSVQMWTQNVRSVHFCRSFGQTGRVCSGKRYQNQNMQKFSNMWGVRTRSCIWRNQNLTSCQHCLCNIRVFQSGWSAPPSLACPIAGMVLWHQAQ